MGATVAAVGGYLAGRAQGSALVEGVKLQLSGQREDAVWQAEVDAFAALVSEFNEARMQIGNVIAVFEASRRDRQRMAPYGFGGREESVVALVECVKRCVSRENALRLRTSPSYADGATSVREALVEVTEAVQAWCIARASSRRSAGELRRAVDDRMDTFRSTLDAFVEDAQVRFSHPRPM